MDKSKIDLINSILKKDKSILAVYIFGSEAKDKTNIYSDIDISILFDNKIGEEDYTDKQIKIGINLSRALNKEVDVIVLNHAASFLKYHILKEGLKIYERPNRSDHSFEAQAIIEYLDFLPVKNRIENGMLTKIKKGAIQEAK